MLFSNRSHTVELIFNAVTYPYISFLSLIQLWGLSLLREIGIIFEFVFKHFNEESSFTLSFPKFVIGIIHFSLSV